MHGQFQWFSTWTPVGIFVYWSDCSGHQGRSQVHWHQPPSTLLEQAHLISTKPWLCLFPLPLAWWANVYLLREPADTLKHTRIYFYAVRISLCLKVAVQMAALFFLATASTWFSAVGPFFDYVLCEPALWFPLPWGDLVSNPPPNLHPNIREGWIRGLGLVAVWLYTQPVRCSLW